MPTIRHEIRNEYGLGSSKLYAVADKDDPEALLESVAVAGLIGLLRQLGDLAEVAAEVFHSLHEEITSTASRGHKLMARVQQLETEVPSIGKVMFPDSASSCLSYNEGIDWRCNLQMDHNLITTGNMPYFIMDTYEECRGPPEFFNLDKFDIAGAGACLKRYSYPSFYRMELTSRFGGQDAQREKRASKVKSKVSFSCNGDSSESFTRAHTNSGYFLNFSAELQPHTSDQVFGETLKHVKLKPRRLNESVIYNLRSFMGNIADLHPREQQVISETSISKSIMTKSFESSGNAKGIHEIGAYASSDVEEGLRPPPTKQEITTASDLVKKKTERKHLLGTQFEPANTNKTEGHSAVEEVHQNGFFTAACSSVNSSDGYVSDEISSELENYVDALTTMESETETDAENQNKPDSVFVSIETPGTDSDTNDEQYELNAAQQAGQYLLENSTSSPGFSTIFRKGTTDPFFSDTLGHMAAQLLEENKSRILSNSDISSSENSGISFERTNDKMVKNKSIDHLLLSGRCIVEASNVSSSAAYGEAYFSSNTSALSTIPLETEGMDETSIYCESETDQAVDTSQISSGEKTNMAYGELAKEDGESYSIAETAILDADLGDVTVSNNVLASSKLVPPLENFDALTQGKTPISIISRKEETLCSSDESDWSDEKTNDVAYGPPRIVGQIVLPHKMIAMSETLQHLEPIESCKDQDSSSPCLVPAELLDINDTCCLKPPHNYFLKNSNKSTQDVFLRKAVRTFEEAYRKESSNELESASDLEEGPQLESSALNFIEDIVSQRSTSIYPTEVIDETLLESSENKNLFYSSASMLFPSTSANEHIITSKSHALHSEDSSGLLVGDDPNLILPHDSNDIVPFARISSTGIELPDGTMSSQAARTQITASDVNLSNTSNSQVPYVIMQQFYEEESELASSIPHLEKGAASEDNQEVSKIAKLSPISWRLTKPSLDPSVFSSGATQLPSTLLPVCQQEPLQMLLVEGVEIADSDSTEQSGKSYHSPSIVEESRKHDNLISDEEVVDQVLESLVEEDKQVSDASPCGSGNDAYPLTFVEAISRIDEPSPSSEIHRPENGSANLDRESSSPFSVLSEKLCHQVPGSVINAKLPPLPMSKPKKSGNESPSIEEMNLTSLYDSSAPTPEYGKPPRKLHSVFIKPNDPLIEAIASHDKSKLRKAPELVHPSAMPNCDERGSFLEQIKNKSFSLKPTVAPTIKFKGGPPTNLKVIAILEKANAIRQACAGSDDDDDDEDSWSDS